MAKTQLILHPGELPSEGKSFEGELCASVFDLHDGLAKPISPLHYALQVSVVDGFLVLQGHLSAHFEFVCALTTKKFEQEILLNPYLESIELENQESVDLTEQLREDILLALPAYPKAPGAESEADFPDAKLDEKASSEGSRRTEWDALDGLKTSD